MVERNVNIQTAVGTTSTVISVEKDNQNGIRSSITCINTSVGGEIITLSIASEAVANKGIVISPGGSWTDSRDGGYKPTQQQITAICDGAGGLLSIQERVV